MRDYYLVHARFEGAEPDVYFIGVKLPKRLDECQTIHLIGKPILERSRALRLVELFNRTNE